MNVCIIHFLVYPQVMKGEDLKKIEATNEIFLSIPERLS